MIGEVYRHAPISRGEIWRNLERPVVRENSPEADLYKLLMRDLSTGGVIRQQRQTDYHGNFIKKAPPRRQKMGGLAPDNRMKSAFDTDEDYVLTELGSQFVHYAMNEIAPRVEFRGFNEEDGTSQPG